MRIRLLALLCLVVSSNHLPAEWHEHPVGELQEKAQALADLAVKEGMQGALQFCAYKDGKCIVDVWAGTMTGCNEIFLQWSCRNADDLPQMP